MICFNRLLYRSTSSQLTRRPFLKDLIAIRECHPRLLASGPDMPCRSEPRCIIERSGSYSNESIPGWASNPGAAFRANPPGACAATVGEALERPRFHTVELERCF